MDFKQLTYFKTIVEQGTISKAAKVLHMAQPPLSIALKNLEEQLNTELFHRGNRKLILTESGKLFYRRTLQILELCHQASSELKQTKTYTLRIGITSSNGAILFKVLPYLKETFKDLQIEIKEGNTYELVDSIKSHLIDLAIIRTPFDHSSLNTLYLQKEPMYALSQPHFLEGKKILSIDDLKQLKLIIYRRYESLIVDSCLKRQFNPTIVCKNDDCRTSLMWANAGQGVAIVPKSALTLMNLDHLVCLPIDEQELTTTTTLIWPIDYELSDPILKLIDIFKQKIVNFE